MQAQNFAHIASQTQAMRGHAPYCGDGVWFAWHPDGLFAFLCDASGHGRQAEHIQQAAIRQTKHYIQHSDTIDLVLLFQRLHQSLHGSRGLVAIALVLQKNGQLDYVHIGDVSLRHFSHQQTGFKQDKQSNEQQGIIAYCMPKPRIQHWQCQTGQFLILHSDGIRNSVSRQQWPIILQSGQQLTHMVLYAMQTLADGHDDASCIIIHYCATGQHSLHGRTP